MVLSLRFLHQNLAHTSPFLHTCHMPRPSHFLDFITHPYYYYYYYYFFFFTKNV